MKFPPSPDTGASLPRTENARPERVALLGHDLRAAASDILGGLRLIRTEALDPAMRLQLERVRAASETLARLLEEGLDLVAEEIPGPEPRPLRSAQFFYDLEMRWAGAAQARGLSFHIALSPDVPPALQLDRLALERVLGNLLSNAIKFTERGSVRMMVERSAPDMLAITVVDDGPGFGADNPEHLFGPGARGPGTTDNPGQGLGLFIAQQMLARMGGTLQADNTPRGGARLRVNVPVRVPAQALEQTPLPDMRGCQVLIVEDSVTTQTVLAHMFETLGARCEIAGTAEAARQALETGHYDLAIFDIELQGASGLDLIRALRQRGRTDTELPVIACSAYVLRANHEAILAAGANSLLPKPVLQIEALAEAIRAACKGHKPAQGAPPPAPPAPPCRPAGTPLQPLLEQLAREDAPAVMAALHRDLSGAERALIEALAGPDPEALRQITHSLRPIAATIGASELAREAEALSRATRDASPATLRSIGRGMLTMLDRLIHQTAQELRASQKGGA